MKRIISICLVFMLLFTSTAMASEDRGQGPDEQDVQRVITESTIIEPRYTYLGYMSVGLDIDENGYLIYGGSARAPYYNVRITLYLQRSTNGFVWNELESTIKTGYDNVAVDGWRNVTAGNYYYRVKIVTDVMDSNRNIIETATGYSDVEQY